MSFFAFEGSLILFYLIKLRLSRLAFLLVQRPLVGRHLFQPKESFLGWFVRAFYVVSSSQRWRLSFQRKYLDLDTILRYQKGFDGDRPHLQRLSGIEAICLPLPLVRIRWLLRLSNSILSKSSYLMLSFSLESSTSSGFQSVFSSSTGAPPIFRLDVSYFFFNV